VYLLDTNICIALIKNHPTARLEFEANVLECYVPSIVVAELYKGVYCSQRVEQNLTALHQFLGLVLVIPFDQSTAQEFGKIQGELRRIGRPTGEMDALIAGVARSRQDVLVTNNVRHFENVANLQIQNWLEA
jgi:tRNA(fMet)-specific endonuclease VapC